MQCDNCGNEISVETDTYYETVTPVEGSGQTTEEYCSVKCLNADVGFTDAQIEALMRQEGYEVPPDFNFEWAGSITANIDDLQLQNDPLEGEFFVFFEHVDKNYDVEVYHNPDEQLFEVGLYTYEREDSEKIGYDKVKVEYTAVLQRALAYAERFFRHVEEK